MSRRLVLIAAAAAMAISACANPFGPHYEYEEQVYVSVDGQATVSVDASLPALVALRGAAIDPSVDGKTDRDAIRRVYESGGCRVDDVSRFWQRNGRRFVQITLGAGDLQQLSTCSLLAWSAYSLVPLGVDGLKYQQTVGAPVPASAELSAANWDGTELIAFKVHVPARIRFHNVKRLDGTDGDISGGNILTWEQRLADRRAGKPVVMQVDMDATSILRTTLWIFAGTFAAAVVALVLLIWWTMRRGRRDAPRRRT